MQIALERRTSFGLSGLERRDWRRVTYANILFRRMRTISAKPSMAIGAPEWKRSVECGSTRRPLEKECIAPFSIVATTGSTHECMRETQKGGAADRGSQAEVR